MTEADVGPSLDIGRRSRAALIQLSARLFLVRGISALGIVVLARVLTPADFGVYAVLVLWVSLVAILGDSGFAASLVQQRHEPTPVEMGTAWLSQLTLAAILVLGTWIAAPVVAGSVPGLGPDFAVQLSVVSLCLPFVMLRSLPSAMMTRVLRFGPIATVEVIQHVVFYGVAIGLALTGAGAWSFVVALLAMTAIGATLMNLAWRIWPGIRFDPQVCRRQLGFGFAFMSAHVLTLLRDTSAPVFGWLAGGVAAIGHLQFAFRIGQIVASIDEVMTRVTFPAFSRLQDDRGRMAWLLREAMLGAALIVGAFQVWLIAVAPVLIPVALGDRWSPSVVALQLVCLGTLAMVPVRSIRSLVFGQGRSREGLRLTIATTVLMLLLGPLLVVLFGLPGGGLAFAATAVIALVLHARAVRDVGLFPWLDLGRIYLICGAAGAGSWLVLQWVDGVIGLIVSAVVFAVADLGLLMLFARPRLSMALRLVRAGGTAR